MTCSPLVVFLSVPCRQSCAIESAASRSGLEVVVVMTASVLELGDNTTCELYRANMTNLHFFTVDLERLARNTPLGRPKGQQMYNSHYSLVRIIFSNSSF